MSSIEQFRGPSGNEAEGQVAEADSQQALAEKRSKKAERQRQRRQEMQERWERRKQEFPKLKRRLRDSVPISTSWNGVPRELYSPSQWRFLGRRVSKNALKSPRRYIVIGRGSRVVPLFQVSDTVAVPSRRQNWDGARLWTFYQKKGLTLAHAVCAANRLVKVLYPDRYLSIFDGRNERHGVYALKNCFLEMYQHCLVEGRIARIETKPCWSCFGSGTCSRCGGSGIYSTKTLYEHRLNIDGRSYSFHSYIAPQRLSDQSGADLPQYGNRFTGAELRSLHRYRLREYILMIAHALGKPVPYLRPNLSDYGY